MQQLLLDFISKYVPLTNAEEEAVSSLDIFRTGKKGEILLQEGQICDHGFFVLNGCIRTYYMIDGEEETTAFYTEMEGINPQCLIDKKPSQYYISCTEDTVFTVGTSEMEEQMFEKFPKFETVCRLVSEELLAKQQIDFDKFKTSSPEQRYIDLLDKRPDLLQRVPQHQLASFLGIKPQSLSRLRARIRKRDILK